MNGYAPCGKTGFGCRLITIIVTLTIVGQFLLNFVWIRNHLQNSNFGPRCTNEDLVKWAIENGGDLGKVAVGHFMFESEFENRGHWLERIRVRRGLKATQAIQPGEVILSIPKQLLVSNETAHQTELGQLLRLDHSIDQYTTLALLLLQERAKGRTSSFYPYVCSLPSSFDTPLYWGADQLSSASASVNATDLLSRASHLRTSLHRRFNRAAPILARLSPDGPPPDLHLFKWALTAVLSRNWAVVYPPPLASLAAGTSSAAGAIPPAYGSDAIVMAPIADMVNHDRGGGSHVAWLDGGARFGLVARRAYAQGEEVLTSYGAGCNARFLATYGFAPAPPRRDPPCAPA
jgi:hypothetical protein